MSSSVDFRYWDQEIRYDFLKRYHQLWRSSIFFRLRKNQMNLLSNEELFSIKKIKIYLNGWNFSRRFHNWFVVDLILNFFIFSKIWWRYMSIIILLCNSSCPILYWRMKWQIVHDIHKKNEENSNRARHDAQAHEDRKEKISLYKKKKYNY